MLSVPPKDGPDGQLQLHASTVVINGNAAAITGPSGSGKTALAFALMTRGAALLADDVTWLTATPGGLLATCPPTLKGRIEGRGVGILNAVPASPAPLMLVVDLGTPEPDRIPPPKTLRLAGCDVTLLHTPAISHFADVIWHYMMHGLVE